LLESCLEQEFPGARVYLLARHRWESLADPEPFFAGHEVMWIGLPRTDDDPCCRAYDAARKAARFTNEEE
jgi:hypothetical protein